MRSWTAKQWSYGIGGIGFVALLAYLAFHYARLTDFPIGDDPAVHVHTIKTMSYSGLFGLPYPLPLLVYKFVQQITGADHALLFVNLISAYLFFAALSLTWFVRQAFKSWPLAIGAALIFVASRWVNDGLRMGLLAETFSWSIFFLTLGFLARRSLIGTLISTGVLVLSHPFATLLYAILFLVYSVVILLQPALKEERSFIVKIIAGYVLFTGLIYLAKPAIIQRFLEFKMSDPPGWGDRPLSDILLGDDERRFFIPYVAGLGLFGLAKNWSVSGARIVVILLIIALFFSLNYLFGVSFIPFRFYVYLEMMLAILAAAGLLWLLRESDLSELRLSLLVGVFALLISMPNIQVNQRIGYWQATRPEANAILMPEDLAAIAWIKENTEPTSSFMVTRSRGIWIMALADRPSVQTHEIHYSEEQVAGIFATGQPLSAEYLYYPRGHAVPPSVVSRYHQVFKDGPVSIWQVDDVST